MTQSPTDATPEPEDRLLVALAGFVGCIAEELTDICSVGLTIGDSYVPFDPDPEDDCEDDEAVCSQAWVRVDNVSLKDIPDNFDGDRPAMCSFRLTLEVGVLRCVTIPEHGEAPTATDVMAAAFTSMNDMQAVQKAALSCEVWDEIEVGQWQPLGPLGGQYGGTWQFTVELD